MEGFDGVDFYMTYPVWQSIKFYFWKLKDRASMLAFFLLSSCWELSLGRCECQTRHRGPCAHREARRNLERTRVVLSKGEAGDAEPVIHPEVWEGTWLIAGDLCTVWPGPHQILPQTLIIRFGHQSISPSLWKGSRVLYKEFRCSYRWSFFSFVPQGDLRVLYCAQGWVNGSRKVSTKLCYA